MWYLLILGGLPWFRRRGLRYSHQLDAPWYARRLLVVVAGTGCGGGPVGPIVIMVTVTVENTGGPAMVVIVGTVVVGVAVVRSFVPPVATL